MKKTPILAALAIFISIQCFALGESWINKTVTATGDVWLRSSPPKGLFCSKGKQIALVKKNEEAKVLEHVKITCALAFSYDFLRIKRLGAGISESERYGYVAVIDDASAKALFTIEGQ